MKKLNDIQNKQNLLNIADESSGTELQIETEVQQQQIDHDEFQNEESSTDEEITRSRSNRIPCTPSGRAKF